MNKPANEPLSEARAYGAQLRYVSTRRIRKLRKRGVEYRPVCCSGKLWSWLMPLPKKPLEVVSTLYVCTDCLMVIANDDSTGIESDRRERQVRKAVHDLGPNVAVGDSANDQEFSTNGCDCCGDDHSGARHEVVLLGRI